MNSFLRSWLTPGTTTVESGEVDSTDADSDDTITIEADEHQEDDIPPAFPALNSAQRATPAIVTSHGRISDNELMPPPRTINKANGGLLVPNETLTRPTLPPKKRAKVALTAGHSPLDWAALKSSGADLRGGVESLSKIPTAELKRHNKRDDAWTAINGKVYNITPYLDFHPGGIPELMRVAGRDGTTLFGLTHAWVNADFMLDKCMVGWLVL